MEELVLELCRKISMGESFIGNEKELVLLDAEEHDAIVEKLEETIDDLEYKIDELEYKIDALEDQVKDKNG